MSTKTTIKRIALVAAAALTIGGFSAVSANAAAIVNCDNTPASAYYGNTAIYGYTGYNMIAGDANPSAVDTYQKCNLATQGSPTVTGIAGAFNNVTVRVVAPNVAATDYVITVSSGAILSGGTIATGGASTVVAANTTTDIVISTPVIGTQTVSYWVRTNGLLASAAAEVVTINVIASPVGSVYSSTSNTLAADATGAGTFAYTDTDGNMSITAAASDLTSPVAWITVDQQDATGASLVAGTKAVTAVISGVGTLSTANGNLPVAPYQALAAASANSPVFKVFADGRAGVANVTISVNGVATDTFKINFYGAVASYATSVTSAHVKVGNAAASVVKITAKDSLGSVVPAAALNVKSSATSVATVNVPAPSTIAAGGIACNLAQWAALGTYTSTINALTKGKVTLTVTNSLTAPTITATADTQVTGASAASLTMALSSSSYATGEAGKLTFTLKDSDGNPVGDGAYLVNDNALTPIESNVLVLNANNTGAVTVGNTITTTSGVATYSFFSPTTPGDLTFTGVLGTGADLAAALRGTTVTATASVTSAAVDAAALAQDAANAATDAANNAYDEAQNATQAASDALAAVTALAKQVKSLIASVKKLTAAVAKLKK
ncbi:hypothetical protein MCEMZLE22_01368 [actinobacterium SCGC AAA044-D11]